MALETTLPGNQTAQGSRIILLEESLSPAQRGGLEEVGEPEAGLGGESGRLSDGQKAFKMPHW